MPIRYGFILATLSAAGLVAVLVMRPTWEAAGGGAWPTAALVAAGVGLAVGIVWGIVALQRE